MGGPATPYTIRPLDASTWDAFAELVERSNGVFGGCWRNACLLGPARRGMGIPHRKAKEDLVRTDRAHAALVIDQDDLAQGWCQYGSPEELPGIKHGPEYEKDAPPHPDWQITCIYVDKVRGDARTSCRDSHRVSPHLPATRKQNVRNPT